MSTVPENLASPPANRKMWKRSDSIELCFEIGKSVNGSTGGGRVGMVKPLKEGNTSLRIGGADC